jgi:hypothetical protein
MSPISSHSSTRHSRPGKSNKSAHKDVTRRKKTLSHIRRQKLLDYLGRIHRQSAREGRKAGSSALIELGSTAERHGHSSAAACVKRLGAGQSEACLGVTSGVLENGASKGEPRRFDVGCCLEAQFSSRWASDGRAPRATLVQPRFSR